VAAAAIRVMTSYGRPRPTTNPYIVMLDQALASSQDLAYSRFSWRTAFSRRYDVFHTHWTEALMDGRTRPRATAKQAALLAAVLWMRLRGVVVVRTMHNVEPPSGLGPLARLVLTLVDRGTRLRILINEATELPRGQASVVILHGHYRDWFASLPRRDAVRGRLCYFGLVRRYKGVETLVDAFVAAHRTEPELSLRVAGRPSTEELAADLRERAARDPAVRLDLRFLEDAELVEVATEAELVVLPYRFMHNSGSVLAALSLDRPVLVPRNEANQRLAAEVGEEWLQYFDGELSAEDLVRSLGAVRAGSRSSPDLSRRDWDQAGPQHVDAYRQALSSRG
jgi:glycosyltransferase involved in cell wall biosynthesis